MLIRLEQVRFTYPGGVAALQDLSLEIQPGEAVALVGQNGSGKTTLARHLNGLLRPQAGRVWLGGWLTSAHSPAQLARRAAYVFQNPDEQLFRSRVLDEVAFGPQNLGYPPEQTRELVAQALALLELSPFAQANPRDLGYSRRKRLALAAAIAMDTPVLICDEPTAGLDAHELELLSQALAALRQQKKTLIVISHDLDFLAENLERFVLLRQGRLVLDAPAPDFFAQEGVLESCGLIPPQMARLSRALGRSRPALSVEQFLDERSQPAVIPQPGCAP